MSSSDLLGKLAETLRSTARELNELEDITQQIAEASDQVSARASRGQPVTGDIEELLDRVSKFTNWQFAQRRLEGQRKRAYARSLLEKRSGSVTSLSAE